MPKHEKLLQEITDRFLPEPNSGCWLWIGSMRHDGYGQYRPSIFRGKRSIIAHRIVYEYLKGPIPAGLDLDHLCRVRSCVNPAHLEPVTRRENLLRGDTIPARNAKVTHCPRGHALEGENLYIPPSNRVTPYRSCLTCRRAYNKTYKRKSRAKA